MKININEIKKYISTHDISFLADFDRTIEINKTGKSKYFKMYRINSYLIEQFIINLDTDKIYLVNPFITINCKYKDPVLTLSTPFLITNNSNPKLIQIIFSCNMKKHEMILKWIWNNLIIFFLIINLLN